MTMTGQQLAVQHLVVVYGVVVLMAAASGSEQQSIGGVRMNPKMLADVESRLLQILGLTSRPRPNSKPHIPEYMLHLYRASSSNGSQQQQRRRTLLADTVRSFHHQESEHDFRYSANDIRFWFNVSGSLPASEVINGAELRLYREKVTRCGGDKNESDESGKKRCLQRILVYDVLRPSSSSSGDGAVVRLIDSRQVDIRRSSWEAFDVSPAVVRWQQQPSSNYGLHVRVQTHTSCRRASEHVRLRRSASAAVDGRTWPEQKPLLVVHSDGPSKAATKSRQWRRRDADRKGQRRKSARDNCRRHQLYVDFSDVGWNDWIVAPPGYQAYYCHGECNFPLADHLNSTNHAIVQTLMHSVKPHAVPRVCCVPTQLSSISMLYLDEYDKVVLKNYQDMVVQGCGCR